MNRKSLAALVLVLCSSGALLLQSGVVSSDAGARDPGVRGGTANAGDPLHGLSAGQTALFNAGLAGFNEAEDVARGLGPTMNLDSCGGCHAHPSAGGTSPPVNPQVAFAHLNGARNLLPAFITPNGPVREARLIRGADGTPDGGVHGVFTIAGRYDAPGCELAQPDFAAAAASHNLVFRIPTPLYGAGLIEQIPDSAIIANLAANAAQKGVLGILGRPNIVLAGSTRSGQANRNGNDGTIARFGWKAQNKSLLLFSAEAYNVEMGISNELFPTERNESAACQFAAVPNDVTKTDAFALTDALSDMEKFAFYMRFLAPPTPSSDRPGGAASIARGKAVFAGTGCAHCHTPALDTGNAAVAALRNVRVNLYSDLAVHDMGRNLADGVSQGQAGPSEFRSAPLWGLGQRLFFLHDGRTADLVQAIREHRSDGAVGRGGSEANAVIARFESLAGQQKQDLLNFLRSL